jgi:hypothetical protein
MSTYPGQPWDAAIKKPTAFAVGFLSVGTTGQISNLLIQDIKHLGAFISLNGDLIRIGLTV